MSDEININVAVGAAVLDRVRPGWHHEINQAELDMVNCQQCVLGQLYGHFGIGLGKLYDAGESSGIGSKAGFSITSRDLDAGHSHNELKEPWLGEIRKRLHRDYQQPFVLT